MVFHRYLVLNIMPHWIIRSLRGDAVGRPRPQSEFMSTRDKTAVQPRFALFAIAGLIVLAVIVAALTTSFDRYLRQPAPLTRDHASSLNHA